VRAKHLAPVYFKETNFNRYCELISTSVLGKLTEKKVIQINPLPLLGLKNNIQGEIVKISKMFFILNREIFSETRGLFRSWRSAF
jgi:hypothetical protein